MLAFISGAELIIHNAPFDVGFLDAEFARLPGAPRTVAALCRVLDTLTLARSLHPGQRNSLDALCKRYSVDNTKRELHGALLDAGILVDVYLAMTGGQSALALDSNARGDAARASVARRPLRGPGVALAVPAADADEVAPARSHARSVESSRVVARWSGAASRPSSSRPAGRQIATKRTEIIESGSPTLAPTRLPRQDRALLNPSF